MKVKVNIDKAKTTNEIQAFAKELVELCKKYEVVIQSAEDEETKEKYIVIRLKDFVKAEDIKIDLKK